MGRNMEIHMYSLHMKVAGGIATSQYYYYNIESNTSQQRNLCKRSIPLYTRLKEYRVQLESKSSLYKLYNW